MHYDAMNNVASVMKDLIQRFSVYWSQTHKALNKSLKHHVAYFLAS